MAMNKGIVRAQKACFAKQLFSPIYTEMTPRPKLQLTAIKLMHPLSLIADSTDMSMEISEDSTLSSWQHNLRF